MRPCMYYWSTTFCSGRKIHTTHVFPVLPEGISNEMPRQRVSKDPKKFLFYASFPPDYKRRGKNKIGGNWIEFQFLVFFAAFTRYQWVRSTIASHGKPVASCPQIPREITPKRSLVEVYYPQALPPAWLLYAMVLSLSISGSRSS